jgi:AmmeMemoRadiSam system protein A
VLDTDARRALIAVARDAVAAAAEGREPAAPAPDAPELQDPGAAFVTLRRDRELRGCIGHLAPGQPLWRSVQEMAAAAASRDDRFDPVRPDEIPDLRVEISVLSPRRRVAGADDVRVGRDGLYVSQGPRSGLLLPQVAAEHGWTAEEFLAQACRKAGLPPDAWRDPETAIETFTAEVFGDEPESGIKN